MDGLGIWFTMKQYAYPPVDASLLPTRSCLDRCDNVSNATGLLWHEELQTMRSRGDNGLDKASCIDDKAGIILCTIILHKSNPSALPNPIRYD